MRIGITERGDSGVSFDWIEPIRNGDVDGAVLITKKINEKFIREVINLHQLGRKMIVHCTVTGWGNTIIEPRVPCYQNQLDMLLKLIDLGFPLNQCVLRIDPIFPTTNGLSRIVQVIGYADSLGLLPMRVRVSILDEYKHVKERFVKNGFNPIYGETEFQADDNQVSSVAAVLNDMSIKYGITFECCAEQKLADICQKYNAIFPVCIVQGCISRTDLELLEIQCDIETENIQKRTGCHCLSCKTELLKSKKQCPNGCMYCYWKTN